MGEQNINSELEGENLRVFVKRLLNDLNVLDGMIRDGKIESGVERIGAEQELFLVDQHFRPALASLNILQHLTDPHFTTELGLFNLEINLDPFEFSGDCFNLIEKHLEDLYSKLRQTANELGIEPVLVGILPTILKSDLVLENLTPKPRYLALNRVLSQIRGGDYEFYIRGLDELSFKHSSIMVETCNSSFQVHLQVSAEEFAKLYNIAQLVTGPVLAAATNSPLLLGRKLWQETRIALFRQAVDTRLSNHYLRERSPRVTFGTKWVKESVLELYHEDVTRFRSLLGSEIEEDPDLLVEQGMVPQLVALKLHNGTVYRWNRPCYGVTNGKPHLRIENRVLPSGPTLCDEVANAAFWLGLMEGCTEHYGDISQKISFEEAKGNFYLGARLGLTAQFTWLNGKTYPANNLILEELLPIAREGLQKRGIRAEDIDHYLGMVEERVSTGQTGSQWMLQSMAQMKETARMGEQLNALTAAMIVNQKEGIPVAKWEPAKFNESEGGKSNYVRVEQYMTTDLVTVQEDEPIDLVANLMDWNNIRHVPVENHNDELVGLVSYRDLLRLLANGSLNKDQRVIPVSEIMKRNPICITPDTPTLEALTLMREHKVSCLPVVKDGRLLGIVSERDFMNVTAGLLEQMLKE